MVLELGFNLWVKLDRQRSVDEILLGDLDVVRCERRDQLPPRQSRRTVELGVASEHQVDAVLDVNEADTMIFNEGHLFGWILGQRWRLVMAMPDTAARSTHPEVRTIAADVLSVGGVCREADVDVELLRRRLVDVQHLRCGVISGFVSFADLLQDSRLQLDVRDYPQQRRRLAAGSGLVGHVWEHGIRGRDFIQLRRELEALVR